MEDWVGVSVGTVWWVGGWIWCSGWWMGGLVEVDGWVDVFGWVWLDWWAIGGGWVGGCHFVGRWRKRTLLFVSF